MHRIELDVGGTRFATAQATLAGSDSFFSGLVGHAPEAPVLFVDRDPTHFRHVLNWLRGVRVLPRNTATLTELRAEADFYCMLDMRDAIDVAIDAAAATWRTQTVEGLLTGLQREVAALAPAAWP